MYSFDKEFNFHTMHRGKKSTGDRTLAKLLKSPADMASGIATRIPSNPIEFCDKLELYDCH